MMMSANLVGFVIGTEGIKFFLGELFGTLQGQSVRVSIYLVILGCTGLKFLIGAVACLFVGVQIMFEYRYVLFWDRNDNTQCIISGKKKCDRACVGVVDQNRG